VRAGCDQAYGLLPSVVLAGQRCDYALWKKNMAAIVFTNEHALIKCIENLSLNSSGIVSIDGVDGVGKSTLACKIAEELSLPCIEIDTFVQGQHGGYIDYIDYDRLSESIKQAIITNQVIILEGICVQQVLQEISLNPDISVYVKVINDYGFWMDQIRLFPPNRSADEMINERKVKRFSLGHIEEIIRYHYTFKPYENADYIFEKRG